MDFQKINFNGSRAQQGAVLSDGRFLLGIQNADSTEIDVYRSWHGADELIPIGNATQEEMDAFLAYVEGVTEINDTDPQIHTIFWEEAEMYLAGDQSAEKCAEMIRSRVSLYLSEQS